MNGTDEVPRVSPEKTPTGEESSDSGREESASTAGSHQSTPIRPASRLPPLRAPTSTALPARRIEIVSSSEDNSSSDDESERVSEEGRGNGDEPPATEPATEAAEDEEGEQRPERSSSSDDDEEDDPQPKGRERSETRVQAFQRGLRRQVSTILGVEAEPAVLTVTQSGLVVSSEHGIFKQWFDRVFPPESRLTIQAMIALGLCYFSLGSVVYFSSSLQSVYLESVGNQLLGGVQVTFLSIVNILPHLLKILFGVSSDRIRLHFLTFGHRRPYILAGLLLCAAGIAMVAIVDPSTPTGYTALVVLSIAYNCGLAMFNAAADGWGIDIAQTEEQESRVQAFMIGGRGLGVAIVALIMGVLQQYADWSTIFILLGSLLAAPFIFTLFMTSEPPRPPEKGFIAVTFFKTFLDPFLLFVAISGMLGSFTIFGVKSVANSFLEGNVIGQKVTTDGFFVAISGFSSFVGAVTGQYLVRKLNFARAYPIVVGVLFGVSMLQAVVPPVYWAAALFMGLFGLADGLYQACYFALSMGQCNRKLAATHFSFIFLISYIGTTVAEQVAPILIAFIGNTGTYLLIVGPLIFQIPVFYVLFYSKYAKKQREKESRKQLQRRLTMRSMLSLQQAGMTDAMVRRMEQIASREADVGLREEKQTATEAEYTAKLAKLERRETEAADTMRRARETLAKVAKDWSRTRQEAAWQVWQRELQPTIRGEASRGAIEMV